MWSDAISKFCLLISQNSGHYAGLHANGFLWSALFQEEHIFRPGRASWGCLHKRQATNYMLCAIEI